MNTYTLKVTEVRRETQDTITLCFKQPALRKIKYSAGQYLTLIFRINGRRYIRPYSFSSAPLVDSLLEISIKRVPNGIVSNHIHDEVKIDSVIEVMQPMGDFVFQAMENCKSIYFWGVGSGITPLISIIKSVLSSTDTIRVNLMYGSQDPYNTIFYELINNLQAMYPLKFSVTYFYTKYVINSHIPGVIEGRIGRENALNIIDHADVIHTSHYICGPLGLKESIKDVLRELNVPSENIFSEDFELIKDPKDFEEVHTQHVQLKLDKVEYVLEVTKGKSILEAALDAGLEVPYSCQTGSCSTCKAICLDGELKMIGLTRERDDLEANEYLLCCSHPITNNVCVEI